MQNPETNQENKTQAEENAQPFDPNNAERIAELEAKFENKEMSQDDLSQARDINEFSSFLSKLNSFNDSVAGSIGTSRFLGTIQEINLDLGQAVGLMRQTGSAEGTPKAIVDKVYAEIASLPPDIQKLYRPLVMKYLEGAQAELVKG